MSVNIYKKTIIAMVFALAIPAAANAVTIDFEADSNGNALVAGQVIDDEFSDYCGLTIGSTNSNGVMIFDSANPTGEDFDLATATQGNILIISEDGDSSDPDDSAAGGSVYFSFAEEVEFGSATIIDIDSPEAAGYVAAYNSDGDLLDMVMMESIGDNSIQTLDLVASGVSLVEVFLPSSGGIDDISFEKAAVPEPSTLALLALGGIGLMIRRRAA